MDKTTVALLHETFGDIVAKETSVLISSLFGSCTGNDARRSSHAHPEDSFLKSTSYFVQVKPIHNLVFFRYSCTCGMLTRTFLCLLRNTVSRSFTVMFLAIFRHVRPEDSYAKSTPPFVQTRPINNLVRFRCSCTCLMSPAFQVFELVAHASDDALACLSALRA